MLTITSNTYEGRYLRLEVWEDSADAAANASVVCWRLTSLGGYSSYYYIADTAVTLDGQVLWQYDAPAWDTNWASKTFPVKTGQAEGRVTVNHNADGKKTIAVSLSTRVYVSTTPAVYSGALSLTDIPRDSPVTAQDMVLGEPCRVSWTPAAADLYYKLVFVAGTRYQSYGGICPGRTTAYTFRDLNLPLDLARGLPNSREGELKITLTAHRDFACTAANQVGEASTATCRVTVPDSLGPGLSLDLAPTGDLPEAFAGLYLQGKTGLAGTVTASAQYGASVQSYRLSAGGQSASGAEPVLNLGSLTQYGSQSVTATVQDSRGLEATAARTIQVLPYARPRIQPPEGKSKVQVLRCDAAGGEDDSGAYVKIQARRSYSPVLAGGVQKNFCQVACRIRPEGGSWSGWQVLLEEQAPTDQVSTGPLLGSLEPNVSYQVQIRALDTLGEQGITTVSLSTQRVYCHRSGVRGSFAFGKLAEGDDVFDIAPDKTLILRGPLVLHPEAALAVLDIAHPLGSVLETAAGTDPNATLGGVWTALASPTEGFVRWQRVE